MFTGLQAFHGDEVSDVLASVLKTEPDWNLLANPKLRDLLRRCLEKDAKRRWHAIADVRLEIETVKDNPARTSASAPAISRTNAVVAGGSSACERRRSRRHLDSCRCLEQPCCCAHRHHSILLRAS
jgi:hypothetical protein